MIDRLGGWQRLGIVLSLLWIVGAVISIRVSNVVILQQSVTSSTNQCFEGSRYIEADKRHAATAACLHEERTQLPILVQNVESYQWYQYLYFALIPVPFGWLFGFIALSAGKWVRTGFREA